MRKTSPRIQEDPAIWYENHFKTLNAGLEFYGNGLPGIHKRTLHELRGHFSEAELMLIIEVMNGKSITTGTAGLTLYVACEDGIRMKQLERKWGVDRDSFLQRLKQLRHWDAVTLEVWAAGFWNSGLYEKEGGETAYCSPLLAEAAMAVSQ
jgi:hypothetical protein